MSTRTAATSKDRDSKIRQRCGCKSISSYAESCSAPSSRRHVEDVHSIGVDAARCARRETCIRNQQANPRPLNHPIPQPKQYNTQACALHENSTKQHVLQPPAKIATPRFGSDVAARPVRATLRAAVLQAPDVTLKMSTALELLPSTAQGMRLAHAISRATPAHSSIRFPKPHTTPHKDATKKHGNTYSSQYSSHQRRSRLQDSAEMWLQDLIELRRELQCSKLQTSR